MDLYPVTPSQKRIFVLQQFDGIDSAYNIPDVININGLINRETVRKALQGVRDRHEILRTTFLMRNGEIKQKVHKKMHLPMDYVQAQETEIDDIIKAFIKPFDLEKGPLLRATFVKLEERKHILLLDFHHIVTDWASNNIFVEEFCNLYLGNELIALKIQFKDYAVWHSKIFETDYMKKQEQYWMSVFSDTIPVLNLPTDYPRQLVRSFKGDRITFELDKDLTERVNKLARDTGSTLYMVLLSVYNILLSKFTGQEDIVVGSACSGRIHPDVGNLIGMIVNSVAIRNYPKSDVPFEEFLTSVRENSLNALKNQDYPIEEIVRKLKLGKDRSRNPLFDTVFILENIEVKKMEINGLEFSNRDFEFHISKFDLSLYAMEDQTIKFSFEYSFALFKEETVRKMADLLVRIIKQVVDNPDVKLADIQLMTEEERKNLLTNLKVTSSIDNSIDIKNEESTEGEMEFEFDF
jgi:fengycin family lipopeptide synthetase D